MHLPGRKKGSIKISAVQENGQISITVRDDGNRVTCSVDINRTNSLGIQLIRTLVQHHVEGFLTITSGKGTEVRMEFPALTEGYNNV